MPARHLDRLARWLHGSYLFGLGMQFMIGTLQLTAAIVLTIARRTDELTEVAHWMRHMIATQLPDPLAVSVLGALHDFSVHPHAFWTIYMVGHGLLNLGVVIALLARRNWAYPLSIVVLVVFIIYQLGRYVLSFAPVLLLLSAFDAVVIALVWHEWQEKRAARAQD